MKFSYVDNLKVFLTALVVLHHVLTMYGASGSWYFMQVSDIPIARAAMSWVTTVDQSFFMGLFFFMSGLFVEPSFERKGMGKFVLDKLTRLGIPLIFYTLVMSPSLNYISEHYGKHEHDSFAEYMSGYRHWVDFGVLWFVEALLLFNLLYAFCAVWLKPPTRVTISSPLSEKWILAMAAGLGIVSFLVRGFFPVGWSLFPLNIQPGHFPQYIASFIAGIVVFRHHWLEKISAGGAKWIFFSAIMAVIVLPLMVYVMAHTGSRHGTYNGGFTRESFFMAIWEQITGISIMMALLRWFHLHVDFRSAFQQMLARATYGVYIMHPLVVVLVGIWLMEWKADPAMKVFIAAPLAITGSFLVGLALAKIPGVNRIV